MGVRAIVTSLFSVGASIALVAACGSSGDASQFGNGNGNGDAGDTGDGNTFVFGGDGSAGDGAKACTGLCLQQVTCPGGGTTTVSGKVYDPAGKVPLYNVIVYVPNAPLDSIKTGASCDKCGNVSGDPLVTAITDASGSFQLQNVPVGANIPLVIQVGKWRREVTIPSVQQCTDNPLVDPQMTRLPRNQSEGDMPQMAIATGNADPFECLLTKMGIDTAEFTPDTGTGRVHYYVSNGVDMSPPAPKATTLWTDLAKMKGYDMIMLPCEGGPNAKGSAATQNLVDYTHAGGRVFTTHFGYVWLATKFGQPEFSQTGTWKPGDADSYSDTVALNASIDQSFVKGAAFAQWLVNVNASSALGTLPLYEVRHDLLAANAPLSQQWVSVPHYPLTSGDPAVLHMTFNTPVGAPDDQVCGRVVYSDFHVSAQAKTNSPTFPASCKSGNLSAQEKALEFMFFDLASCIQNDNQPPAPPPPVK